MTRPSLVLSEDGAGAVLTAAREHAAARGATVGIAVVDAAGHLAAFLRMDGAPPVSVEVAIAKARSSALLAGPTAAFEDMVAAGALAMVTTPGVTPLRGGVPVAVDGVIVGAVGVSGSTGDVDEAIAVSAADSLRVL